MIVVGIDEVGRGCWAGPVVAGAVILKRPIPGLKDSKLLSKVERERLAGLIYEQALAVGLGWIAAGEVDRLGLTAAVSAAMQAALNEVKLPYDEIIIDGHLNFLSDNSKARALIKADNTIAAVSAASIVAKVARDEYMTEMGAKYPNYGFESHVGYGTARHLQQLQQLGVTKLHRLSFKPIRSITESTA